MCLCIPINVLKTFKTYCIGKKKRCFDSVLLKQDIVSVFQTKRLRPPTPHPSNCKMASRPRRYSEDNVPEEEDEDIDSDEFDSEHEMENDATVQIDEEPDSEDDGSSDSGDEEEDIPSASDDEMDEEEQKRRNAKLARSVMRITQGDSKQTENQQHDLRPDSDAAPLSSGASGQLLSADALLGALSGGAGSGVERLKEKAVEVDLAKSAAAVPLAKVITDREKRKLGYAKTKEVAQQWIPLVKEHREKDHISYPLAPSAPQGLTNASLTDKFQATNEMESAVQALLQESGMDERDVRKKEDQELELNKVTKEEILQRRAQMAKMRSVLFYQEQKAKRIKKIKSKMYHKIRNKQLDRFNKVERERLRSLDPELARKLDEEDAKKYAEERFTLRHRNMSKWAKNALKRGQMHKDGTREAVEESLRIGQELKRKQRSVGSDSDESSDEEGSEEDSDSDDYEDANGRAKSQTKKLLKKIGQDQESKAVPKGIMGLKFMQRATDSQKKKAREDAELLLKELGGDGEDVAGNGFGNGSTRSAMKFGKRQLGQGLVNGAARSAEAPTKARERINSLEGSDSESEGEEGADTSAQMTTESGKGRQNGGSTTRKVSQKSKDKAKRSLKKGTFQVGKVAISSGFSTKIVGSRERKGKDGNTVSSVISWDEGNLKRNPAKLVEAELKSDDASEANGAVESNEAETGKGNGKPRQRSIQKSKETSKGKEENPWLAKPNKSVGTKKGKGSSKEPVELDTAVLDTGSKTITEENENAEQKAIVQLAFAGDNVEEQFEKEKAAEVEESTGKPEEKVMSGWGSWAGMGAPAKKKWASKKYNKKKKKQQAEKDAAKEARRDADLKHVIINEKRNKRAAKYNVEAVPHPFKSRAHYEASLRNPLGPEWNTTDAHSALVRPKVIIDHGAIIDPIKMSESYKRKLPNLLESSFNTHRKKQRIMRATSRKSKF